MYNLIIKILICQSYLKTGEKNTLGQKILKEEATGNHEIKQPVLLFIFLLDYCFSFLSKEEGAQAVRDASAS